MKQVLEERKRKKDVISNNRLTFRLSNIDTTYALRYSSFLRHQRHCCFLTLTLIVRVQFFTVQFLTHLMGSAQSIPVVGEIVTVADAGARTVAAGACAVVGQSKAAEELIQGAGKTLQNYTEVSPVAAGIHVGVLVLQNDMAEAERISRRPGQALAEVAENTPIIGHIIGGSRLIEGDLNGALRPLLGATRSTVVAGIAFVTAGLGAIPAGIATAGTGVLIDAGLSSALQKPTGIIAGFDQAIKSNNANDWFSAFEAPVADGAAGAFRLGKAGKVPEQATVYSLEALGPRRTRVVPTGNTYKLFNERPRTRPQVARAEILGNSETKSMIRNVWDLRELGSGSYDFVRLPDGSYRAISHADAIKAPGILGAKLRVGHTSLVEPGGGVIAAGEAYIKGDQVSYVNCQSGHFRVPLQLMKEQVGAEISPAIVILSSPTLSGYLAQLLSESLGVVKEIAIHSTPTLTLVLIITAHNESSTNPFPISSSPLVLSFFENNSITTLAFSRSDKVLAEKAYQQVPTTSPKILIDTDTGRILASQGDNERVETLKAHIALIDH